MAALNKVEASTVEKVFSKLIKTADSELILERRVLETIEEGDSLLEEVSRAIDELEKAQGVFKSIINKLCK
ncbi:hypothetical protein SAMN05421780_108171 [Flexibacter flexilis DSM 6793]|uniref:Uncharacterized protein n=1 Tax=Flexibacter flexilis DSM 6793 TaxID=927664 RepID=A0A1I1LCT0_9BACT|nr:hypothetical protein [Flexibacter flexilis]SFC70829.1 hypothetical protein SAMN05421780_108171 [Flexibacter flexilis DSM 6793]